MNANEAIEARIERSEAVVDIKTEEFEYVGSALTEKVYKVGSVQNGAANVDDKFYRVTVNANGVTCDCPDATYRGQGCKHAFAVMKKIWNK